MNVSSVDLNLLKAFDALMVERHVTRAGAKIGLAQPSMSNALSRLRSLFHDELFVRTPQGMAPTAKAQEIAPIVSQALSMISEVVEPSAAFDPLTAKGEVRLATSDNLTLVLGTQLAEQLRTAAPGIDLAFRQLDKPTAFDSLDKAQNDFLIGTFDTVPARFFQRPLLEDSFVCLARRDHPGLRKGMSLRRFAEIPHVLMTLSSDHVGVVDRALRKSGFERRVAMAVSSFIVIPDILQQTDYIAAIPASLAEQVAERSNCLIYAPPIELPSWTVSLVWSQSANGSPLCRFVADQIDQLIN